MRPLLPEATLRPELTLPSAEAAALRAALTGAEVVLEYGSGGSTLLAAELPGKQILSVESDPAWAAGMAAWLAAHPPVSPVHLHRVDIGPVKAWGYPADTSRCADWWQYPHSVWALPEFRQPDLVLIDGRFRAACFATVALRCRQPVTVLFDDYRDRADYHSVEQLARPVEMTGRMARFELRPMTLPPELTGWYAGLFTRPK